MRLCQLRHFKPLTGKPAQPERCQAARGATVGLQEIAAAGAHHEVERGAFALEHGKPLGQGFRRRHFEPPGEVDLVLRVGRHVFDVRQCAADAIRHGVIAGPDEQEVGFGGEQGFSFVETFLELGGPGGGGDLGLDRGIAAKNGPGAQGDQERQPHERDHGVQDAAEHPRICGGPVPRNSRRAGENRRCDSRDAGEPVRAKSQSSAASDHAVAASPLANRPTTPRRKQYLNAPRFLANHSASRRFQDIQANGRRAHCAGARIRT